MAENSLISWQWVDFVPNNCRVECQNIFCNQWWILLPYSMIIELAFAESPLFSMLMEEIKFSKIMPQPVIHKLVLNQIKQSYQI